MILVLGNLFPVYVPGSLLSISFRFMIVVLVENLFLENAPGFGSSVSDLTLVLFLSIGFPFMIVVLVENLFPVYDPGSLFEYRFPVYDRGPCGESVSGL
jgi:hypothetical protein